MCNRTISHSVHSLYSLLFTSPSSPSFSLPPTPSLPLYFLSLSLPPFSLFPSSHIFIPPCFLPSLHCCSWLEVHLSRYNSRGCLASVVTVPPFRRWFYSCSSALLQDWDNPPPPHHLHHHQPPSPAPSGSMCSLGAAGCLCVLDNRSLDCYPGPWDHHLPHHITASLFLPPTHTHTHTSILARSLSPSRSTRHAQLLVNLHTIPPPHPSHPRANPSGYFALGVPDLHYNPQLFCFFPSACDYKRPPRVLPTSPSILASPSTTVGPAFPILPPCGCTQLSCWAPHRSPPPSCQEGLIRW